MNFLKGFVYALKGIRVAWIENINLRVQSATFVGVVALGIYVHLASWEWCVILFASGMVVSFELINSSIEELTNIVQPEYDLRAGKVKDMAAGAVLTSAIVALVVGLLIFGSHLVARI
jgi:diacylglycerol kinase